MLSQDEVRAVPRFFHFLPEKSVIDKTSAVDEEAGAAPGRTPLGLDMETWIYSWNSLVLSEIPGSQKSHSRAYDVCIFYKVFNY